MSNDNNNNNGWLGAFVLLLIALIWALTINHTTKDLDLLDALIENKQAGGPR